MISAYVSTRGEEINQPCCDIDTETQRVLAASDQTFEQALLARRNKYFKTVGSHLLFEEVRLSFHLYVHSSEPHFMVRNLLFNVTRSPKMHVSVWISSADSGNVTEQAPQSLRCPSTTSNSREAPEAVMTQTQMATPDATPSRHGTSHTHSQS